eukprot:TRINITY_DN1174_c0_g1_i7.p1 TRINITY_DN1174_c0_g1~~TRINITY_DN1174_c0_g1_i7.p1  ORF type:complete len:255 (+),score=22.66 TRINITY_DN1174_c0_g1_i7:269-1033(+)
MLATNSGESVCTLFLSHLFQLLPGREYALCKTAINLLLINDGYEGPLNSFSQEADDYDEGYSTFTARSNTMTVRIYTFRLPDGNIDGSGFQVNRHQSLHKCYEGAIIINQHHFQNCESKRSTSKPREYNFDELVKMICEIVQSECHDFGIKDIESVVINTTHPTRGCHSDHRVVGRLSLLVAKVSFFFSSLGREVQYVLQFFSIPSHIKITFTFTITISFTIFWRQYLQVAIKFCHFFDYKCRMKLLWACRRIL